MAKNIVIVVGSTTLFTSIEIAQALMILLPKCQVVERTWKDEAPYVIAKDEHQKISFTLTDKIPTEVQSDGN